MSVELGYQGSSKSDASIVYFNLKVDADGKTKNLTDILSQATNQGKKVSVPKDFIATSVQLANVPNGINVEVAFSKDKVTLTDTQTSANLKSGGDQIWPSGTITASIKK